MPKVVQCPHCGAENPYSLVVTMCQQCKGDLSGAQPVEAPAEQEGRPQAAKPAEVSAPREAPIAGVERPPVAPAPRAASRSASARRADSPVVCGRCGYTNVGGAVTCVRCKTALEAGEGRSPEGFRSCTRCGHRQDARRISCEKCGVHFLDERLGASVALTGEPMRRAPKSSGENAVRGCAVGCLLAMALAFVFWLLLASGTMR